MKNLKIAAALLTASLATSAFALDGEFGLKGNVQTQVTKSIADEDNNFSSGWIRANVGGQYKSENLDGLIMLRIFAPEFGNKNVTDVTDADGKIKTTKTAQDKILADLYWANYKWKLGENNLLNLQIGHWKTDWSQSTNFGTYVDAVLTKRGLWMRDYSHNALELGWKRGLSNLTAMLATQDGKANRGYVRLEEDMKFTFPLEVKVAYRGNLIDVLQNTAYLTHRVAAYASFGILPMLRVYGEYACVYTQNDNINENAQNYIAPETKYYLPGIYFQPFYVGIDFAPKDKFMSTFLTNLMFELEYINKRDNLYAVRTHTYDDLAWTVAWNKKIGSSRLQFSLYSENELSDLGMAFRLTTTFK